MCCWWVTVPRGSRAKSARRRPTTSRPTARRAWDAWFANEVTEGAKRSWSDAPLIELCHRAIDPPAGSDTTVFLSLDRAGDIAAAASTSGWGWKYPGRLSDSPIVGAGCYADTRYGACACTGTGEMAIRAGTARAVVLYLKMGLSLTDALYEAAQDMRGLQGGLISGIAMHAIDAKGNFRVVSVNGLPQYRYWMWHEGMAAPESRGVDDIVLTAPRVEQTVLHRYMTPP